MTGSYKVCMLLLSRPYLPECLYCDIDFDVIGKLEDFHDDVAYIAERRNLTDHLRLLNHVQQPKDQWTQEKGNGSKIMFHFLSDLRCMHRERREKYMSQLSQEMVQDLYELYKIDFEMFGYD